jgi:hypothetical protein
MMPPDRFELGELVELDAVDRTCVIRGRTFEASPRYDVLVASTGRLLVGVCSERLRPRYPARMGGTFSTAAP